MRPIHPRAPILTPRQSSHRIQPHPRHLPPRLTVLCFPTKECLCLRLLHLKDKRHPLHTILCHNLSQRNCNGTLLGIRTLLWRSALRTATLVSSSKNLPVRHYPRLQQFCPMCLSRILLQSRRGHPTVPGLRRRRTRAGWRWISCARWDDHRVRSATHFLHWLLLLLSLRSLNHPQ